MSQFKTPEPKQVFHYFEEISSIPRGSGNMKGISQYCEDFAKEHNLKYVRDAADNIIIFKNGTKGYENSEPIILQGHLDMVCQKTEESTIDFNKDGISLFIDGDFIKAENSTLGADNGIAVAIILALLESQNYSHPPIEAVFTVDEEIGMLGAIKLDKTLLKAKKMINMDSEDEDITVSCAGGEDFTVTLPFNKTQKTGTKITVNIKGLCGGHSGIEINNGKVNANLLMGRVLDFINQHCEFEIIKINGGDKANAIPNLCSAELCVADYDLFCKVANEYFNTVKSELAHREKDFSPEIIIGALNNYTVMDEIAKNKLILTLLCIPNGVMQMSAEVNNLVETSLNLGILKTEDNFITLCHSLRSNKKSAQDYLKRRLSAFFNSVNLEYTFSGYYPPWEFNDSSLLQKIYSDVYKELHGKAPKTVAIHAGLECGVFSSSIKNFDCISVGPALFDVHTTKEKLSISSTQMFFNTILAVLERLK